MWSATKPIGTSTTPVTPRSESSSRWSLTSGSSHGWLGGPEREQYASDHCSRPRLSDTSRATDRCWRSYRPQPGPPLASFICSGTEWVTKTTCASGPTSASAAFVYSVKSSTNTGWLKWCRRRSTWMGRSFDTSKRFSRYWRQLE
jgi:hypothetical protein